MVSNDRHHDHADHDMTARTHSAGESRPVPSGAEDRPEPRTHGDHSMPGDHAGEHGGHGTGGHGGHGGHGDAMLERIRQRALAMGLESLFVLTTRTSHWVQERGFQPCTIEQLPRRKAELYNFQRNSRVFRLPLKHSPA